MGAAGAVARGRGWAQAPRLNRQQSQNSRRGQASMKGNVMINSPVPASSGGSRHRRSGAVPASVRRASIGRSRAPSPGQAGAGLFAQRWWATPEWLENPLALRRRHATLVADFQPDTAGVAAMADGQGAAGGLWRMALINRLSRMVSTLERSPRTRDAAPATSTPRRLACSSGRLACSRCYQRRQIEDFDGQDIGQPLAGIIAQ